MPEATIKSFAQNIDRAVTQIKPLEEVLLARQFNQEFLMRVDQYTKQQLEWIRIGLNGTRWVKI